MPGREKGSRGESPAELPDRSGSPTRCRRSTGRAPSPPTFFAPIARPAFTWNHDKLMTDFGRGLAKASRGVPKSVANTALKPGAPGFYEMPALDG